MELAQKRLGKSTGREAEEQMAQLIITIADLDVVWDDHKSRPYMKLMQGLNALRKPISVMFV